MAGFDAGDDARMMTPPGWYDDPQRIGFVRWWDGTKWTDGIQPKRVQRERWKKMHPAMLTLVIVSIIVVGFIAFLILSFMWAAGQSGG
jgi:hypothetical protein